MNKHDSAVWRKRPRDGHPFDRLNRAELKVMQQLTIDGSNGEIARHLDLPEQAVRDHVLQILEKLELANRGEATRLARQNGLRAM